MPDASQIPKPTPTPTPRCILQHVFSVCVGVGVGFGLCEVVVEGLGMRRGRYRELKRVLRHMESHIKSDHKIQANIFAIS